MARVTFTLPKSRRGRSSRQLDGAVIDEAMNLSSPEDGAVTDGETYETSTRATSAASAYRIFLKEKRGKNLTARIISVDKDGQPIVSGTSGFHYVTEDGEEGDSVAAGKLNDGEPAGYVFALVAGNGNNG